MRAAIYLLPLLIVTIFAAPQERCPDGCKCTISPTSEYMARCTSLESIDFKKHPSITALDLSNLNIEALPPKLRKMKGLREVDLSGNQFTTLKNFPKLNKLTHLSLRDNQLTVFDAKNLPNSIVDLDLSHNQITHFMGLTKLPKLKTLRLEGNAIECDCPFASHMEILLNKFEVILEDSPKCSSPSKLQGVLVSRVYCVNGAVLFDEDTALNDEPIEDEYMPSSVDSSTESEDEGSGSGDGAFIIPSDPEVPNCFYNCSTAAPITEDDSLPRADIGKELVNVLLGTTTQKQDEEPPMGDPIDEAPSRDPVDETIAISTAVRKVAASPGKEVPHQEGSDKESARAALPTDLPTTSDSKKSNATTYIIVGALLVVMVALIAYVVIKKKKSQPQGEVLDKVPPVEMKPLMSKPNGNDATTLPERTPLMNGQNGHTENGDAVKQADMPDSQVEVRPKADDESGVIPERVTITAKELSSPKSPVLVQRRLEDDGRIVDHIVDPGKS